MPKEKNHIVLLDSGREIVIRAERAGVEDGCWLQFAIDDPGDSDAELIVAEFQLAKVVCWYEEAHFVSKP